MARIASLMIAATLVPIVDVSVYNLNARPALTPGIAAVADTIDVAPMLRAGRVVAADVRQLATLGAGATVKLVRFRPSDNSTEDLTVATAAGGAAYANGNTIGPRDVLAGDVLQLVVGGANITAAAIVEVDVRLQH